MDLLTQLNSAVEYIEENICNDIQLAEVSKVTAYSPYHFGRLFYYITDMPISEYIRRRKLSFAAMELQNGRMKIIDLAVKYGYDSADSFTRAFIKQHGATPTEARRSGVVLKLFPPITFQIKIQGVQGMNWRIEEKEAFEVFGIERVFKNDETDKVPEFWDECHENGSFQKLKAEAYKMGNAIVRNGQFKTINAICGHIEPGEDKFPYMICAVKNERNNPDGYKTVNIPKSLWVIFSINREGGECKIGDLWEQALAWLPSSDYDRAPSPDMEVYGDNFEEVWIPVVKK